MSNLIIWFDLPVKNLDRAIRFYSAVLGRPAQKQQMPGMSFAILHDEKNEAAGCLTPGGEGDEVKPSADGMLPYFNCEGRLDDAVAMVEVNGGRVLRPKHPSVRTASAPSRSTAKATASRCTRCKLRPMRATRERKELKEGNGTESSAIGLRC